MSQTSTNLRNSTFLTPLIAFTMLVGVGTGGQYTLGYHAARSEKLAFNRSHGNRRNDQKAPIAAEIDYIKTTLDLTMTELARCLAVSRQAPYNWIAGGVIKAENVEKLNSLKAAADIISAENVAASPLFMQRKLEGGKTLVEAIAAGEDARKVAQSLVELYRIETEQRKMLADHFAGRRPEQRGVLAQAVTSSSAEET